MPSIASSNRSNLVSAPRILFLLKIGLIDIVLTSYLIILKIFSLISLFRFYSKNSESKISLLAVGL